MAPQLVVLSAEPARLARLAHWLRGVGLPIRSVTSPGDFPPLRLPAQSILLLDADFFGDDADSMLDGIDDGTPVIVVVRRFDRMRWINLMKRGANDVLREPISAGALQDAVNTVLARPPWIHVRPRPGWGERVLRAGKAALGLSPPSPGE